MDKLRSVYTYLYQVNYAYVLVLGLLVKAIASDISYPTFLLAIPVLGFEGYKLYLQNKKPDPVQVSAEVQKDLDQLKSKLNALTIERNVKPQQQVGRYF